MRVIIILTILSFLSCTEDPKITMIKDLEQTIEGTKTDLSMKVHSIEFLKEMKAIDSAKIIYSNYFDDTFDGKNNYIDSFYYNALDALQATKHQVNKYDSISNSTSNLEVQIAALDVLVKENEYLIADQAKLNKWELGKFYMDEYVKDTGEVLGLVYKVKYTIKNPFLNNVEQELNKTYLFSMDESRIISSLD